MRTAKIHQLVRVQINHVEKRHGAGISRVQESCSREGDKPSNGLVENAMTMLRGVIRTIKCHVETCTQEELRGDSPILPWWVEHAESILSRCQKGRDGRTPFERLHGNKPTQESVPFEEKVVARPISSELLNRTSPVRINSC